MMPRGYGEERPRIRRISIVVAVIIVLAIVFSVIISSSVVVISAGTRGVVLTWGRVDRVLDEGLHFIFPVMQRVEHMDVTIQKVEASESTASSDLQEITTAIAVNYRLNPGYVDDIYKNLRHEYESRVIRPNIEESIKATTANFTAEELVTKRHEVKLRFSDILKEKLDPYHIEVLAVSIVDFQFSVQFKRAIDEKVTAEQEALKAKNVLVRIEYEQQQKVIQAEAEAEKRIIEANAYYNATIKQALADAEALKLRRQQLDPNILYWLWLEKWDGRLPNFLAGQEGVMPIIQIAPNSTPP